MMVTFPILRSSQNDQVHLLRRLVKLGTMRYVLPLLSGAAFGSAGIIPPGDEKLSIFKTLNFAARVHSLVTQALLQGSQP
jgi:hypothetical protein